MHNEDGRKIVIFYFIVNFSFLHVPSLDEICNYFFWAFAYVSWNLIMNIFLL